MRREKFAILVEGYFDALRCFDAGIENVVATCGTALTAEQASLIRRYVPSVVLVYDGDAAGIQAALKGTGVLTAAGLAVRAMALPGGQDPDDFIRNSGGETFRRLVTEASDFVTFYARQSESRLGSIEGRTQVAHELFDILRHIEDEVRLDEYLGLTADRLGLNPWACRKEYEKYTTSNPQRKADEEVAEVEYHFSKDDCDFLAALMHDPALLETARKALELVPPRTRGAMVEVLEVLCRGGVRSMQSDFESEEARRLYAAAAASDAEKIAGPELLVSKRLKALEKDALRIEAAETITEIQEAERAGDPLRLTVALQRKVQLKKQLERVGAS
jgi:DNA primase